MADTKISSLTALTGAGVATNDQWPMADVSATATKSVTTAELMSALGILSSYYAVEHQAMVPTGAIVESFNRNLWAPADSAQLSTGRLNLYSIGLIKGQTITSITFRSGTTAVGTGANQWFGLFDSSRVPLRFTTDDTSTAWSANTMKTLNLSSTFQITYTGLHYIGINVTATQVPTLFGVTGNTSLAGNTPILRGTSSTGLSNPASCPNPAGTITATAVQPYFYLS